jgi:hypothetical protein
VGAVGRAQHAARVRRPGHFHDAPPAIASFDVAVIQVEAQAAQETLSDRNSCAIVTCAASGRFSRI